MNKTPTDPMDFTLEAFIMSLLEVAGMRDRTSILDPNMEIWDVVRDEEEITAVNMDRCIAFKVYLGGKHYLVP